MAGKRQDEPVMQQGRKARRWCRTPLPVTLAALIMIGGSTVQARARGDEEQLCAKPPKKDCVATDIRWDDEDGDGNDDTFVSYFTNNCGTRVVLKMCNQRRRAELAWGCEVTTLRAGQTKFLRTSGGATGQTKWAYLASRDSSSDDQCKRALRDE